MTQSRRRWMPVLVLVAMTTVQALLTASTLILPAIAPRAATALNVPSSWIGLQVSFLYASATVISLFSGRLVRRFGAVAITQWALGFMCCGLLLAAVPSSLSVAVGSLFLGVAYGTPAPAAAHLLARFTPAERRNLMFSLKQTGVPLGGVLAGFVAPPLASAFDWWVPLVVAAAASVVLAVLFLPLRALWDDDRVPGFPLAGAAWESFGLLLAAGPLRFLAVVGLLLAAVQLCLVAFLVVLLVEDYGFTLITAGAVLAAVQVAGVLGRIGWGFTADAVRDGLGTLVVIPSAIAILALVLTMVPSSAMIGLVVAILLGLGATAIGWNGVYLAQAARLAPAGRVSETTGALLSMSYLGIFLGPASFTAVVPVMGGYRASFVILAAVAAIAAGLMLAARLGARSATSPS